MKINIVRLEMTDTVTRGVMLIDGVCKFVTLELPWRDNEKDISCIPFGYYHLIPHNGEKYKNTFLVTKVPDRGAIICPHVGNTATDTRGCILIGEKFAEFGTAPAIANSTSAMEAFRRITWGKERLNLEILEL